MAIIGAQLSKADLSKLRKQLDKLSLKQQQKELLKILSSASLPIRKAAKARAKRVIKTNNGFTFKRGGTSYTIAPRTIEKSIGVIPLKKARVPAVDIGFRAKGKYNGWFAHFVDAGTGQRKSNRGNKGAIAPRNIMAAGENGRSAAEVKIKKDIVRVIKRLSK